MIRVVVLLLLAISLPVSAFNWNMCKRNTFDLPDTGARTFLSTSQFLSSTGACAAVGALNDQMKEFYAINFDQISSDAARGEGEYLSALIVMSDCTEIKGNFLRKYLKANHENYFSSSIEGSYIKVIPTVERMCGKI